MYVLIMCVQVNRVVVVCLALFVVKQLCTCESAWPTQPSVGVTISKISLTTSAYTFLSPCAYAFQAMYSVSANSVHVHTVQLLMGTMLSCLGLYNYKVYSTLYMRRFEATVQSIKLKISIPGYLMCCVCS